jgi:hypothetical protein
VPQNLFFLYAARTPKSFLSMCCTSPKIIPWTCSCWTVTASSSYMSNNPPRMQNQRLLVQF